jgi:hypothetical protein
MNSSAEPANQYYSGYTAPWKKDHLDRWNPEHHYVPEDDAIVHQRQVYIGNIQDGEGYQDVGLSAVIDVDRIKQCFNTQQRHFTTLYQTVQNLIPHVEQLQDLTGRIQQDIIRINN